MDPVRYVGRSEAFESLREQLNAALAFVGLAIAADGKLRQVDSAKTLDEAQGRAMRLRQELVRRKVHPDVLRFCRAELLQENYFHAVFEATRLPLLALNSLQSDAEQSEQRGMVNLLKGMFGTFRNVTAHAPRIHWEITEQDALDLLTLCSLLHRRLDSAVRIPTAT